MAYMGKLAVTRHIRCLDNPLNYVELLNIYAARLKT
jgi:hypothetical protein